MVVVTPAASSINPIARKPLLSHGLVQLYRKRHRLPNASRCSSRLSNCFSCSDSLLLNATSPEDLPQFGPTTPAAPDALPSHYDARVP